MKQDWPLRPLGDVCDIIGGGTPSKDEKSFYLGDIPWATVRDMKGEVISSTECMITKEAVTQSSTNIIPANNVVIATRVGLGKVCLIGQDTAINQDLRGVIPKNKKSLSVRYLFWGLKSVAHKIEAAGTGATVKGVKLPFVKSLLIPVPERTEQQRIVATLDEAFAGIATATANAEKNLQNARELFESTLQSVFAEKGEGWEKKQLGEICQFENGDRGKNYPNRKEYVESGIPWINTGHIESDGSLSQSDMNYITQEKFDSLRSGKIQAGDLVYCLRGATLGKTALVEPYTVGAVASSLVILRPSSTLNQRFLYYYLTSPVGKNQIKLYDNGAAQPNLGAKSVAKYQIYLPNSDEQIRVVQKLDQLALETKRLQSVYQNKLNELAELKQSILQKAFAGELH